MVNSVIRRVNYFIFICTIIICIGFFNWIASDSDIDKLSEFYQEYNRLYIYERYEEADNFRIKTLTDNTKQGQLDEIWLPVVMELENGYQKLDCYLRILAGNPYREESYAEIVEVLNSVPKGNQINKNLYLEALNEIADVNHDLLLKYGLLITTDNTSTM